MLNNGNSLCFQIPSVVEQYDILVYKSSDPFNREDEAVNGGRCVHESRHILYMAQSWTLR